MSSHLSTHVLDAATGRPAAGVGVVLERVDAGPSTTGPSTTGSSAAPATRLGDAVTDVDGRVSELGPDQLAPGRYRVTFDTGGYFAARGVATFYPEVVVTVDVAEGSVHDHVPLLLSPYSYTTYRGS